MAHPSTSPAPPLRLLTTLLLATAALPAALAWHSEGGPVAEALHEHMTPEELGFFFGVGSAPAVPQYEVVALPAAPAALAARALAHPGARDDQELHYGFTAFGRRVALHLLPNRNLLAPSFRTLVLGGDAEGEGAVELGGAPLPCHYLHRDASALAALSLCGDSNVRGFVLVGNDTLEIRPLTPRLRRLLLHRRRAEAGAEAEGAEAAGDGGQLHIVRRADTPDLAGVEAMIDGDVPSVFRPEASASSRRERRAGRAGRQRRRKRAAGAKHTVELALFFDAAAYKLFAPFFDNDDAQIRDMLLAYVNGVQALYRHPSLGAQVELVLVRLELQRAQPPDLPTHGGERGKLLDSFCAYSAKHNTPDDANPAHWDMGLYVSGLDFIAYENGRKSGVTMGLATVGGVCLPPYDCVIAELGTTNAFGKPYPSAGFTSVYVLAHEIGHNLGMHHDGGGNSCPKDGYIMSPSRGTNGETVWSTCSADVMTKLDQFKCLRDAPPPPAKERDHGRFLEQPGQAWGAKRQCEFLLRDRDAAPLDPNDLKDICYNLKCRTPHRSGFYFAGPALEGTTCGQGKLCQGGQCVAGTAKQPAKEVAGGWGPWKDEACASGCLLKSRGYRTRRRACNKPPPKHGAKGCDGNPVEVALCSDDKLCQKKKRKSAAEYAGSACAQFAKLLPDLDASGSGLQAPHEEGRPWVACAVFCKRKDTGLFYTPRLDLNDMGVDAHFPDGTWCHNEQGGDYFCLQHQCTSELATMGKGLLPPSGAGEPVVPQNALPHPGMISDELQRYLSLGKDGKPLLTTLSPASSKPPPDDAWASRDYLELPPGAAGLSADHEADDPGSSDATLTSGLNVVRDAYTNDAFLSDNRIDSDDAVDDDNKDAAPDVFYASDAFLADNRMDSSKAFLDQPETAPEARSPDNVASNRSPAMVRGRFLPAPARSAETGRLLAHMENNALQEGESFPPNTLFAVISPVRMEENRDANDA